MPSAYHTKKLLMLSAVGIALSLIPRRSSKKADKPLFQHFNSKDYDSKESNKNSE